MKNYVDAKALQEYTTKLVAKLKTLFPGTPTAAATVAEMTDHSKTYVYVGTESGYTAGDWYYWNGTAWTSGGPFQATSIITDTTLAVAGEAADAKATGDAIAAAKTAVLNAMAPAYSISGTYAVGDYVNHNGAIYRCTTAITTGEAWTSGHWAAVTLGADLEDQVGALKESLNDLNDLRNLEIDETDFTSGYVWSDGKWYSNSNYIVSPFIRCAFRKIKFNCLTSGGGIQSIAFYSDSDETKFISGYENTASLSTYPVHEMNVPEGTKYIRISKYINSAYTGNVAPYVITTESAEDICERIDSTNETANEALYKIDNINPSELLSDVYRSVYEDVNLIPDDGLILHSYLNDSGEIKTITNTASVDYTKCISGYIPTIPGKVLYLSGDNSLYSRFFGWYDENKQYLGGKNQYSTMGYHNHVASVVVPTNAKYLRITFYTESDANSAWAGYTGAEPTGEKVYATNNDYVDYHYYPTNPCDFNGDDISVFTKILCVGDSITAGYFNTSAGGQTISKYSYPAILQKICGVECTNMGDSGETSVSWWETYSATDFSGYDCAIINLGINDVGQHVSEADTRTAFANIINALKTANTGIKIFIANINPAYSRGNTTYDAINAIIEDIAENTADCYFIDLTEYGHTIGAGYANGHLTACGYRQLANDYKSAISYIIRNNPNAFRWVQFIGTDLHA